jgi:hypothetical protein
VGGAPIVASGGVPPPTTGGFDQDWNVTASTHTKDWADDEWGGAEPQPVVRSSTSKNFNFIPFLFYIRFY